MCFFNLIILCGLPQGYLLLNKNKALEMGDIH